MTGAQVTVVEGRTTVIAVAGEIDYSNVRRVGHELRAALPAAGPGVVVDLSGVGYLDSSGLHMLFELHRDLQKDHRDAALVVPESSPLRRLFKITGLDELVAVATDTAEALELVSPSEPAE